MHQIGRVRKPFFTTGTFILMGFMGVGFSFGLARFFTGLGPVTNLDNLYPWGIWIAIDVACGVALAAGGFTTAALIEIFGRHKYHKLLRPAILTAWLGYMMVGFAIFFDLGRFWNIWRPMFNWQGNSVLFEVSMCVMAYLTVLTIEMAPSFLDGFRERIEHREWGARLLSRIEKPIRMASRAVKTVLPIFIVAGVVLSCMHQSSLGAILVITPTKLNSLWYTPALPALFLLSAIMVGFPMVILESILASKSFDREPEMDMLTPLARKIPFIIAAYGILRFGDLIWRADSLNFLEYPGDTLAFIVEITAGIIAPIILLNQKSIRRSPGWLLFTSILIIFGVVLNRINVYLVGYHPASTTRSYFPAIGEIALTVGLVCTIMFLYRFFVTFFPILSGPAEEEVCQVRQKESLTPRWAWILRSLGIMSILLFVVAYTLVHRQAIAQSVKIPREIGMVKPLKHAVAGEIGSPTPFRPKGYRNLYFLNNPDLNEKTDDYEPARFTHRTHDINCGGDCSVCHHRFTWDDSDRVGVDLRSFHLELDVHLGGACSECHDMNVITIQSCTQCHGMPNEADAPARIGLKGAYHRQCIGCHEQQPPSAYAPTDCQSCHYPYTPDHTHLVNLMEEPDPAELTGHCLQCHRNAGLDVLQSAHWRWGGHSPNITGYEHRIDLGLDNVINNYYINAGPNTPYCSSCHVGYEWKESSAYFSDPTKIDCVICHDTTGVYSKDPENGGLPPETVNLLKVAERVGRPSRENCGNCHFYSDGGANVKHGDLEPTLAHPPADFDVHMGMFDMRCQDCHSTQNHQIAGMSLSAPACEGRVKCEKCHGNHPHNDSGFLSRHLDDHVKAIACETCHIPSFAKEYPTRVFLDYSTAGRDLESTLDQYGKPTYDRQLGHQEWDVNVVPAYRWYNGTREAHVLGDTIDPGKVVMLNSPLGRRNDPSSRIYPFKIHRAVQPYDIEQNILVTPKFWQGFWTDFDWNRAIQDGMESVGLEFSGNHGFVKTEMYTSIHHEVVTAKNALGCTDCHSLKAVHCLRCHAGAAGMDQPDHIAMIYPKVKNRMDFRALGYKDDPARIGGRFYFSLGRGTPPR